MKQPPAPIPAAEPEAGRQQGLASAADAAAAAAAASESEPEPTERKATRHLEVKCQHPPCRHCRQWFLCAVADHSPSLARSWLQGSAAFRQPPDCELEVDGVVFPVRASACSQCPSPRMRVRTPS